MALEYYEKALSCDDTLADVYLNISDIYLEREDFEQAAGILRTGIAKTGDTALSARLDYLLEHITMAKWECYVDGVCAAEAVFDANGNVVQSVTCTDREKGAYIRNDYDYDEAGNERTRICVRYNGYKEQRTEWDYLDGGAQVQREIRSYGGRDEETRYEYNETGLLAKDDKDRECCINSTWEYDEAGRPVQIVEQGGDEYLHFEYEYDRMGNETGLTSYDETGAILWWDESEYDAEGNEIRTVRYYQTGLAAYSWELEYDAEGNRTKVIYHDNTEDGSEWITTYHYDRAGNRVMEGRRCVSDGLEFLTTYAYDEIGNLVREIHYGTDRTIDKWVSYAYDENRDVTETVTSAPWGREDTYYISWQKFKGDNVIQEIEIRGLDNMERNLTYDFMGNILQYNDDCKFVWKYGLAD